MRSLLKLSLLAVVALLVAAGSAMAVDIKFTGNVGTGFGLVNIGENKDKGTDATSGYMTSYEANLRWTIGGGPLTQVFRFRPRGSNWYGGASPSATGKFTDANDGGGDEANEVKITLPASTGGGSDGVWNVADLYAETHWRPVPELDVQFGRMQGGAWSNPMAGMYLIHNGLGVTHQEYWLNWTGADGLDVEYNAGQFQVGLGLLSECKISGSCPGAVSSTQQMTPHASGKFGDIAFRAMLPTTSAKDADDSAVGGSGYQIGVGYTGAGFGVALDIQGFTTKEAGGADTEDEVHTGLVARVDFAGISVGYHSQAWQDAGGTKDAEKSLNTIVARYAYKVGDGTIYPEYNSITQKDSKDGEAYTNTLIRIIGNIAF